MGDSSISSGYHNKVPNQAKRPKNLKIVQMRKSSFFPKSSRIARKSSRMSQHASHEVLQLKSPIQDQKPKTKIFALRPKVPEIPRLLCPWAYLRYWSVTKLHSKVQSPNPPIKGIKKNVRLRKSLTIQNLNNSQYIHRRTLTDGSHGLFRTRPLKKQTILKINIQISWYFHKGNHFLRIDSTQISCFLDSSTFSNWGLCSSSFSKQIWLWFSSIQRSIFSL